MEEAFFLADRSSIKKSTSILDLVRIFHFFPHSIIAAVYGAWWMQAVLFVLESRQPVDERRADLVSIDSSC